MYKIGDIVWRKQLFLIFKVIKVNVLIRNPVRIKFWELDEFSDGEYNWVWLSLQLAV
jgi:hypothetical protein